MPLTNAQKARRRESRQQARKSNAGGNPSHGRTNLPLGRASVATRAEVPRYMTSSRNVWELTAQPLVTSTIGVQTEAALPLGNQYADGGFAYSLKSFYEGSDSTLKSFDQYRFKSLTIYAEQAFEGSGVDILKSLYISVDHDDTNTPSWLEMQSRDNVALAVLRNNNPKQVIANFTPVAEYTHLIAGSSPSNVVPNSSAWFDMDSVNQKFNGIKLHVEAPGGTTTSIRVHALASIEFRGKI